MEQNLISLLPIGRGININVSQHHTFGTDAVLLAHFAAPKFSDRLVDLGTGCGIIPFLMLRDGLTKSAVGVDISAEAISLAEKTAVECGFNNFEAVEGDIKALEKKLAFGCHTLVTCNPPYKAPYAGLKNIDPIEAAARHEVLCTLEDVVRTASKLLQTAGRFCICHRPERLAELFVLMSRYGVEPKRLRLVAKNSKCEPWLVLVEGRRCAKKGIRVEPMLYVETENGEYSREMIDIYGPYKELYL